MAVATCLARTIFVALLAPTGEEQNRDVGLHGAIARVSTRSRVRLGPVPRRRRRDRSHPVRAVWELRATFASPWPGREHGSARGAAAQAILCGAGASLLLGRCLEETQ